MKQEKESELIETKKQLQKIKNYSKKTNVFYLYRNFLLKYIIKYDKCSLQIKLISFY